METTSYIKRTFEKFDCEHKTITISLKCVDTDISYEHYKQLNKNINFSKRSIATLSAPFTFVWRISELNILSKFPYFVLFPFDITRKDGEFFNRELKDVQNSSWKKTYNKSFTWAALQHVRIIYDLLYEICSYGKSFENSYALSLVQISLCNLMLYLDKSKLKTDFMEMKNSILKNFDTQFLLNLQKTSHPSSFSKAIIISFNINKNIYNLFGCDIELYYMMSSNIYDEWFDFKIASIITNIAPKYFYSQNSFTNKEKFKKELFAYLEIELHDSILMMFYLFYFYEKSIKTPKSGIKQMENTVERMIKISKNKNIKSLLNMIRLTSQSDVVLEQVCQHFLENVYNFVINDGVSSFDMYYYQKKCEYDMFDKNLELNVQCAND